MGPQGTIPIANGAASVGFSDPGLHRLTLDAAIGDQIDRTSVDILVAPRRPIDPPLALTIARVDDDDAGIFKAHEIEETLEPAASGPTREAFVRRWTAEDGFAIARIRLEGLSPRGLAGFSAQTVADGAAAVVRFTLRAGSPARPERAWMRARVVLEQTPTDAASQFGETLWMDAEGLWSAPWSWPTPPEEIRLLDETGALRGRGPIGAAIMLQDGRHIVTVTPGDGATLIELRRNDP